MQIMPSTYIEQEAPQSSSNNMDYSQDPSQAQFSQDLDSALSDDSEYTDDQGTVWKESQDYNIDMEETLSNSPYNEATDVYSLFVPQPVRFVPSELEQLGKSLLADGVDAELVNKIQQMAGKVGGPSLDELLGMVKQSMHVGNASLTEKEVAVLQGLSNRISSQNPDKLYNALRYGSGMAGLKELNSALTGAGASLSKEELGVIGKALNLNEDSIAGLKDKLTGLEGKALTTKDINNLFGDVKAEIQSKSDAYDKMQTSLEKHLKPIVQSAEKREELSRQAQSRESKSVLQSRILIEDTVVTRVMGDDLNRSDIQEDKKSEKSRDETKSVNGNNRFTNEDGKKTANAAGSQQNVLSELNKKIVTKENIAPKENVVAEKNTGSVNAEKNMFASNSFIENANAIAAAKTRNEAALLNSMGRGIVSPKNVADTKNVVNTKDIIGKNTQSEKITSAKTGKDTATLKNDAVNTELAALEAKEAATLNNAGKNTAVSENVASSENAEYSKKAENNAVAEMLSEKTRTQQQLQNPLENPLFARGLDEAKKNDNIFDEKTVNSQFLEKKEQDNTLKNVKENFSDSGNREGLKGDDRSKKGTESSRYDYTFSNTSHAHAAASTSSVPTASAAASESIFSGGNASRHMSDIRDQVQNSMVSMAKNGVQRIEISLNPVELGQLNIALSIKNGEINATIQTEKPESASMINMQVDAIRAELENQGFKIEKIEVELGLSQDHRQEWQGMDQHNSKRETTDNAQYFERLRTISKLGGPNNGTLAHNMQDTGSMTSRSANNAMTGLHIIA